MKSFTAIIIAIYISVASAAPAASNSTACPATAAASNVTTTSGANVQAFVGNLGGLPPPVIQSTGDRPFSVNGDTFVGKGAALGRSCDVQHNACANAANSGQLSGGVQQCDAQNQACHSANNLKKKKRFIRDVRPSLLPKRAALDLGTCSNANILFEAGLDGRTQEAFIAANQQDFNHGSALNIGVIAGFICQRLESSCKAPTATQDACAQASSAAVASTQDQSAADAFNAIMGDGAVVGSAANATAAAAAPAGSAASPCV